MPFMYKSSSVAQRCIPTEPLPTSVYNFSITIGNEAISVQSLANGASTLSSQVAGELYNTWPLLAVAAVATIIVTYLWIVVLQFFVGPFVVLTLTTINAVAILSTGLLYLYWQNAKAILDAKQSGSYNSILANGTSVNFGKLGSYNVNVSGYIPINSGLTLNQKEVEIVFWVFVAFAVIASIIFLLTIAMIKRIKIAVQTIKEASRAFSSMPLICIHA